LLQNSCDEQAATIREALSKAADQVLRAGEVIRRLREFVAHGDTEKRIESIRKIVQETSALALVAAKDQPIRMDRQFDPEGDLVPVNRVQIQQVLLNLLRNAIEAMQTLERRELIVSTASAVDGLVAIKSPIAAAAFHRRSRSVSFSRSRARKHRARELDCPSAGPSSKRMAAGSLVDPNRGAAPFSGSRCVA
jgi:two-component system, LuxR family, sensor kinase FixL